MDENNKKGFNNARLMRGRNKGGNISQGDGFDRSNKDTLASHIDRWIDKLEMKNYSPKTLSMNKGALNQFVGWCEERDLIDPSLITKPHLESYQRYLWRYKKGNGKPLSVNTQRQRLGAIQRLFSHLVKSNFIVANPASDLDLPKKPHRELPRGLSVDEVNELLNIPDVTDPLGIRDRAILETFYASGIRRMEMVNLDFNDVDLKSRTLHVRRGKGGKSRLLPVGTSCVYWVERYLDITRDRLVLDHTEQALFVSGYGDRFSSGYIGRWFKKIMNKAGINKEGCLHLFRHSCATHMLENGADIRLIQQMLGHQSLETTSIYTHVAITHLQSVYDETHPRAKGK